jgi:two-component system NtrC family sensor kinase
LLTDLLRRRERGGAPRSLRSELLLNLALLAAAALVLALWTASFSDTPTLARSHSAILLVLLVILDVLIFVALANHLVERLILSPLEQSVEVAESIAGGHYERRVPPGRSAEIATLASALNRLTDQLLLNQGKLAENVRSLDDTNRLLHETQRELLQAEKMASIGRLGAGIAHEIGNPLGALIGYAGVLRRRAVEPELVEGIEREARRIDVIVRELLDYARPAAAAREPVSVNDSVQRVETLLGDQGKLASITVSLDLDPDVPAVVGVPHRVDQMFVNLFANAASAMGGEGAITVVTRRELYVPERRVPARRADDPPGINYAHLRRMRHGASRDASRLEADHDVVHVVVADTGPGIPPEHIESIFDPFYTTKPPGEGTGLGLAIVASTVAELGGRIEATSANGGGATFHLYLPVAEGNA